MASNAMLSDVGMFLEGKAAIASTSAVAAGSGDNAYVVGIEVDLNADFTHRPTSAALVVHYTTTLASTKTLTIKTKIEEDTVTGMGTAAVYAYDGAEVNHGVQQTGVVTALSGVIVRSVDLRGIKQFFRGSVFQDLSATGTDTNQLSAVWLFFSGNAPATNSV